MIREIERMEENLLDLCEEQFFYAPSMPRSHHFGSPQHNDKNPKIATSSTYEHIRSNVFGLIARSVGKKEIRENPLAQAAMRTEWDRLRSAGPQKKGAWREDLVRE